MSRLRTFFWKTLLIVEVSSLTLYGIGRAFGRLFPTINGLTITILLGAIISVGLTLFYHTERFVPTRRPSKANSILNTLLQVLVIIVFIIPPIMVFKYHLWG